MVTLTKAALAEKCNYTVVTVHDEYKLDFVYNRYIIDIENGNDGAFGRAHETLARRPRSNKLAVSGHNENDCYVMIDGKRVPCESKTNGGRIDDIKTRYIVYTLCVHNSQADMEIRPKIMRADAFVSALYEMNAVKEIRHRGIVDGHGIQVLSRKLWSYLDEQLDYYSAWEYFEEDFK